MGMMLASDYLAMAFNKRKHVELGMLSPFSRAAKKSPTHPIQCCGR
jgi:hypothetical protein